MATTTNFGWPTPDDTDLVKNGAAAMRSLGSGIDTSLVKLKGGTTGQILSKASNTDLDYVWIANDQGDITAVTAGTGISGGGTSGDVTITNSMATTIDAKGDLIAGTADNAFARLAVGSNNQVLTADSSTSTGLKWATPSAGGFFKNPVLNSNFSVWQRGTSSTNANAYLADRWNQYSNNSSGCTWSRQTTSDTTNLPFIQYCIRAQRNSGNTNVSNIQVTQSLESVNSIPFAGKQVTLSFYARRGANYSATSNQLSVDFLSGTGTDQNLISGFTGVSSIAFQNVTLTTTWQRFSQTGTISASATQLGVQFYGTPTGTAGAADYYEVTGVQIEIGSSATDYYPNGDTYQAELAACQRYYERTIPNGQNSSFAGFNNSTTQGYVSWPFKQSKRVNPTITLGAANSDWAIRIPGGTNQQLTGYSVIGNTLDNAWLSGTTTGLTSGNGNLLVNSGNNGYLEASAEL